jgi:ubiquinone/menaquinone biosynthesis C-methylase UbiE
MSQHVCPWWLGYTFIVPWRRFMHDPRAILQPFVRPGMTVLEPGPGMGFFTLELARLVGGGGKVVAVDIQPRMLAALARRAEKAGLADRVETRAARDGGLGVTDLAGSVDFVLAFAMVHEVPSPETFFKELQTALKPGGSILLAEPKGHVSAESFEREIAAARAARFSSAAGPAISRSRTAVLQKP